MMQQNILLLLAYFLVVVHSGLLRGKNHDVDQDGSIAANNEAFQFNDLSYPTGGIPSRCLDDPDIPDCMQRIRAVRSISFPHSFFDETAPNGMSERKQELRRYADPSLPLQSTTSLSQSSSYPSSYLSDDFSEYSVSSSPTRDLCYGNMKRLPYKKYCNSEMPSVSLEPTDEPTVFRSGDREGLPWGGSQPLPIIEPSPTPTVIPSTFDPIALETLEPSVALPEPTLEPTQMPRFSNTFGLCAGDCDSPADCDPGLYCFQRMNFEAVPGCPGSELDASRTDYCTNTAASPPFAVAPPPTEDSFRLRLYWNSSYWWQESNVEIEWCMSCPRRPQLGVLCGEGDILFLHYCSADSVYFNFVLDTDTTSDSEWLMQVVDTNLCLERDGSSAVLSFCNSANPHQKWIALDGNVTQEEPFEIGQRPNHFGWDLCLTTHHHPKLGEEVELFPCSTARGDNSSLWDMF